MVAKKTTKLDFESAMGALEQIVEQMERGEISLEESLKQFERGIELTRHCQQALNEAEQKVEVLMQKSGQQRHMPFDGDHVPE